MQLDNKFAYLMSKSKDFHALCTPCACFYHFEELFYVSSGTTTGNDQISSNVDKVYFFSLHIPNPIMQVEFLRQLTLVLDSKQVEHYLNVTNDAKLYFGVTFSLPSFCLVFLFCYFVLSADLVIAN